MLGTQGRRTAPQAGETAPEKRRRRNGAGETAKVTAMTAKPLVLRDHRLTTAEILYRLPDARSVLQSFIWQKYDHAPRFPELRKFLDFWEREIEGPIHSVRIAHAQLLRPAEVRLVGAEIRLH